MNKLSPASRVLLFFAVAVWVFEVLSINHIQTVGRLVFDDSVLVVCACLIGSAVFVSAMNGLAKQWIAAFATCLLSLTIGACTYELMMALIPADANRLALYFFRAIPFAVVLVWIHLIWRQAKTSINS